MKQGLIKRIANGKDTKIWEDNWLPRDEFLRPYGSIDNNPPELVSELIDATSASWNLQKVNENFLAIDVPFIY